jgi:hypothetical protein
MKTTNQIDREANEKKAKEIATIDAGDGRKIFSGECYYAALEAMQWKDKERKELWRITRNHYQEWAEEQIAKEKQKLIEKACEIISHKVENYINFYGDNDYSFDKQGFIKHFKESMKGEQQQ